MRRARLGSVLAGCVLAYFLGASLMDVSTQGLMSTIYVDANSKSDKEDGSKEYPFKSIAGGLSAAAPEADIYVAQGNYAEMITTTFPVHLHGTGGPDPGSTARPTVTGDPQESWIVRFGASGSIDNFVVTSDPSLSAELTTDLPVGISIGDPAAYVEVSQCVVDRAQVGVEAANTKASVLIANNDISNCYIGIGLVVVFGPVSLSSNRLTKNTFAIYASESSPVISGNLVVSNDFGVRIATRLESPEHFVAVLQENFIARNTGRGVWFDQGTYALGTTVDLGGGGHSPGQNVIQDNGEYDLYNEAHGAVFARHNSWHRRHLGKAFDDSQILVD